MSAALACVTAACSSDGGATTGDDDAAAIDARVANDGGPRPGDDAAAPEVDAAEPRAAVCNEECASDPDRRLLTAGKPEPSDLGFYLLGPAAVHL